MWSRGPSNYGPAAVLLFIPAAWLSQLHPALGIVFLKLAAGCAYFVCAWLVYRLAHALGRMPRRTLFLFGFNPLLLNELVANAHVDVWAVMLVMAGLWLVYSERFRWGASSLCCPAEIKLSFLSTTAATGVWLIARRRWVALATMVVAFAAITVAFFLVVVRISRASSRSPIRTRSDGITRTTTGSSEFSRVPA